MKKLELFIGENYLDMYNIEVIYNDTKDKELLDAISTTTPFFIEYYDTNTINGRKEGFRLMNYWSARKLPLVIIKSDKLDSTPIVKYSDIGENAVIQLIKFLNESSN